MLYVNDGHVAFWRKISRHFYWSNWNHWAHARTKLARQKVVAQWKVFLFLFTFLLLVQNRFGPGPKWLSFWSMSKKVLVQPKKLLEQPKIDLDLQKDRPLVSWQKKWNYISDMYSRVQNTKCFFFETFILTFKYLIPSSIYSWSIGHILEHEFFI